MNLLISKHLTLLIIFFVPLFSQSSELVRGCLLKSLDAVSPLGENLNYTQGSGRGVDIAIYKDGDVFARLGNKVFSRSVGDTIESTLNSGGEESYKIDSAKSDLQFSLWVSGNVQSGGHLGEAPVQTRSATLSYRTSTGDSDTLIATFFCE